MHNVQLKQVSLAFGARRCLDGIDFHFLSGQKIALTGANGSGKTTLLKVICNLLTPDSGSMTVSRGARIAYLPQSNVVLGSDTVAVETGKAFSDQEQLALTLKELEEKISHTGEGSRELPPLLDRHHEIAERLFRSGYFSREKTIEVVLKGLGFGRDDLSKTCESFSLGFQMRIALAKVLLTDSDFLLLDEPTNYLDLEARTWLLEFLEDFRGGVLVVSHDRYFLDKTVGSVAELFNGALHVYRGNYTEYEAARTVEMEALLRQYRKLEEEREKAEAFIRRFRSNASKADLVQSRIKQLEKIPRIEIPASVKKIRFSFPPTPHTGKRVLSVTELAQLYGDQTVFQGVSFDVFRGEKIVVVGPNGTGKSTLLRLLAGVEEPAAGTVVAGENVSAGFFAVDLSFPSDDQTTVLESLEAIAPPGLTAKLRTLLGAFLFSGDDAFKPVGVLSGGEQNRLLLLSLLLKPKNLLILDEPTNHLDMASKDVLLDALRAFPGTVIFVSHDRAFIEGLAEKVVEMGQGNARIYNGDYRYYLWKKETEAEQALQAAKRTSGEPVPETADKGKLEHREAKRTRSVLRRIERDEEALLLEIDRLSRDTGECEHSLADEDVYRDGDRVKTLKVRIEHNVTREHDLLSLWQELETRKKGLSS